MNNKVILIHGFTRDYQDMLELKQLLGQLGYDPVAVDFPLTFHRIEKSVPLLDNALAQMIPGLQPDEKIHMVGHSTGGLVIRRWWQSSQYTDWIGKIVFLATPNRGSELADLAARYLGFLTHICKTLQSLETKNVQELPMPMAISAPTGAIAGNNDRLIFSKLLRGESDGKVTVHSVQLPGLTDFILLPYHHDEIHKHPVTAQYVDRFLRTATFSQ